VSGEGILPAIVSGHLAARAIRAAEPGITTGVLSAYDAAIAAHFERSRGVASVLSHLPASWLEWAARRGMESPWFVRQVVVPRFLHADRGRLPAAA
jgi:flavin-dependent dehydrogenase